MKTSPSGSASIERVPTYATGDAEALPDGFVAGVLCFGGVVAGAAGGGAAVSRVGVVTAGAGGEAGTAGTAESSTGAAGTIGSALARLDIHSHPPTTTATTHKS